MTKSKALYRKAKIAALLGLAVFFVYLLGPKKNITYNYESYQTVIGSTSISIGATGTFQTIENICYTIDIQESPYTVGISIDVAEDAGTSMSVRRMILTGVDDNLDLTIWDVPTEFLQSAYINHLRTNTAYFRQGNINLSPQSYRIAAEIEFCDQDGCNVESVHGLLELNTIEGWGFSVLDVMMSA